MGFLLRCLGNNWVGRGSWVCFEMLVTLILSCQMYNRGCRREGNAFQMKLKLLLNSHGTCLSLARIIYENIPQVQRLASYQPSKALEDFIRTVLSIFNVSRKVLAAFP